MQGGNNGVDERVDKSDIWRFGHMERMKNSGSAKRSWLLKGELI